MDDILDIAIAMPKIVTNLVFVRLDTNSSAISNAYTIDYLGQDRNPAW